MSNPDYWQERAEKRIHRAHRNSDQTIKEVTAAYQQAVDDINSDIEKIFYRYAKKNDLSSAEAKDILNQKISDSEWNQIKLQISSIKDPVIKKQLRAKLEAAAYGARIDRLEALKQDIYIKTKQVADVELQKSTELYRKTVEDNYLHNVFDFQQGTGHAYEFAAMSPEHIEEILKNNWSGKHYSKSVWDNTDLLAEKLQQTLTAGLMSGKSYKRMAAELTELTSYGQYAAERLIRTETAYLIEESDKAAAIDRGTKVRIFRATLDRKTSKACQEHDGDRVPIEESVPGKNVPPLHPHCRSWMEEEIEGYEHKIRAARDPETGERITVPASTKYSEWKNDFVNDKGVYKVEIKNGVKQYTKPEPPKKSYLTKKKLQEKIADTDIQIENLINSFKANSYGYTPAQIKKDFNGDVDTFIDYLFPTNSDKNQTLKELSSKIKELEEQKSEWQEKLNKKIIAEKKKQLLKEVAVIEKEIGSFEIKTYSNIWKDEVATTDWSTKQSSIAAKKNYFNQKMQISSTQEEIVKWQGLLDQLQDFDADGRKYSELTDRLAKARSDLNKLQNSGKIKTHLEDFSQARKDAALWAKTTKEADEQLREICGQIWKSASVNERHAIYDYTSGSGKFNRPLSGFSGDWHNYKGVGKVDLNFEGAREEIEKMTALISRSSYDIDVWLQRGCGGEAIDSFLNLPHGSLMKMNQEDLEYFIGAENRIWSFVSTGVAKGKGFNDEVIMNLYCPKGTQMMYAEPFSAFGNGAGKTWNGIDTQESFGYESEMIIQRGASYKITKIEKTGGTIYIDVEVHPENGYELVENMKDYVGK